MKNGHLVKPVAEYIHKKYTNTINTIYQKTLKEIDEEVLGLNKHIEKIAYYT